MVRKKEICNICGSKARIERPIKGLMYGEKYCTNPRCRAYKKKR